MLVLSRKEGKSVVMVLPSGEKITIVINSISGNRTSLGIDAPRDVKIIRGELEQPGEASAA
jgi:carbon storage regulator